MMKVGVTGGIGSGKTIVCRVFECLGIPVYYADPEARHLMNSHPGIREELIALLGKEIYTGKELNRSLFSSLIFQNKLFREKVNRIVHPKVREDFCLWAEKHKEYPYVIEEAAILFESGSNQLMDRCITVISPADIRIDRVMKRAGMTRERIIEIMKSQWPDEEKIRLSDYIVNNDEKSLILPQLLKIHQELTRQHINFSNTAG